MTGFAKLVVALVGAAFLAMSMWTITAIRGGSNRAQPAEVATEVRFTQVAQLDPPYAAAAPKVAEDLFSDGAEVGEDLFGDRAPAESATSPPTDAVPPPEAVPASPTAPVTPPAADATPEASAPSAPAATAPATRAPQATAPPTTAPQTSAPQTSAPDTSAPQTSAPSTSPPAASTSPSTVPPPGDPAKSTAETSPPPAAVVAPPAAVAAPLPARAQASAHAPRDLTAEVSQLKAEMREYPSHLRLPGRSIPIDRVEPSRRSVTPSYTVMKAERPPVIDGALGDWEGVSGIRLDSTNRRGGPWESSTDLSGELRMVWDKQSLYFALEVEDDIVNKPLADHSDWENDCCQFVFDSLLDGPFGGFDDQDLSYCASRRQKGPVLSHYRVRGTDSEVHGLLRDQTIRFTRTPEGYIYEWSLPWERLAPVSPWILGRSGFSFTINDNDHEKFDGALGWTNGVIYGLNAAALGEIIFDGALGARDAVLEVPQQQTNLGRAFTFYQSPGMGPSSMVSSSNRFTFHQSLGMGHTHALPPMSPNEVAMVVRPAVDQDVVGWVKVYRPGQVMPYAVGRPLRIRCGNNPAQAPMGLMRWDLSRLSEGVPASEPFYVAFENSLVPFGTPTPMAFRPIAATQVAAAPPNIFASPQPMRPILPSDPVRVSADVSAFFILICVFATVAIGVLLVRSGKTGALAAIAACLALALVASFFTLRATRMETATRESVATRLHERGAKIATEARERPDFVAGSPVPQPVVRVYQQRSSGPSSLLILTCVGAVAAVGMLLVRSGKTGALAAIGGCLALTLLAYLFVLKAPTYEADVRGNQMRAFVPKASLDPVISADTKERVASDGSSASVAVAAPVASAAPTTPVAESPPPKSNVKPDWVDAKEPTVVGSTYRVTVNSGPWSTAGDCQAALQREIVKTTRRYIDTLLGPGASDLVDVEASHLDLKVKSGDYSTHRTTSVGPMQWDYALLEFSEPVQQQIRELWRSAIVRERLWVLGWVAAGVLLVLLVSYALLDERRVSNA